MKNKQFVEYSEREQRYKIDQLLYLDVDSQSRAELIDLFGILSDNPMYKVLTKRSTTLYILAGVFVIVLMCFGTLYLQWYSPNRSKSSSGDEYSPTQRRLGSEPLFGPNGERYTEEEVAESGWGNFGADDSEPYFFEDGDYDENDYGDLERRYDFVEDANSTSKASGIDDTQGKDSASQSNAEQPTAGNSTDTANPTPSDGPTTTTNSTSQPDSSPSPNPTPAANSTNSGDPVPSNNPTPGANPVPGASPAPASNSTPTTNGTKPNQDTSTVDPDDDTGYVDPDLQTARTSTSYAFLYFLLVIIAVMIVSLAVIECRKRQICRNLVVFEETTLKTFHSKVNNRIIITPCHEQMVILSLHIFSIYSFKFLVHNNGTESESINMSGTMQAAPISQPLQSQLGNDNSIYKVIDEEGEKYHNAVIHLNKQLQETK